MEESEYITLEVTNMVDREVVICGFRFRPYQSNLLRAKGSFVEQLLASPDIFCVDAD
jgi:hypothetical protein